MSDKIIRPKTTKEEEMDRVKDAAKLLAKTPEGEIFLRYLCEKCGTFSPSIVLRQNGIDKGSTEFNEGIRSVYVTIIRPLLKGSSALDKIERPEEN